MPPVTRHQSAHLLRSLPEDLLSRVLEFACEGQPWSKK